MKKAFAGLRILDFTTTSSEVALAAVCRVELGQAREVGHGQVRAIEAHGLFPDRELSLMKRPSFRIATLECIKHG